MQDAACCESNLLRPMNHDPTVMTSSNGKLNDETTATSSTEDICNPDQYVKNEERRIYPNNEVSVLPHNIQSINHPSMWAASSVSATSSSDSQIIQSINSLNNGELSFQQYQSSMVSNASRQIYPSSLTIQANPAANSISAQGKRAITGHSTITNFPRQPANYMLNTCNNPRVMPQWNNSQVMSWPSQQQSQAPQYPPMNMQPQLRPSQNLYGLATAKKQFGYQSSHQPPVITPNKFKRNSSGQSPPNSVSKNPYDFSALEEVVKLQSTPSYDFGKYPSTESQFYDVIKRNQDGPQDLAGIGKLPYALEENSLVDDGSHDQTVPNLVASPRSSPTSHVLDRIERFSRKVFVGGLPPDIDEEEITTAFRRFGALVVDWPHKAESKSYFPPKGYCFLIFQDELSVQSLIESCLMEEDKLYWCVSSPTMKDKPVQIRPWSLSDSDFVMDGSQPLDPRKTIFVGGVPRPLRAVELAMIMDRLYGGVCYAGIDTDPELKYPKGAGRVAFSNQQSYIAAISARFVQLQYGDIDKRVEVKPYVLDDQMCDECRGARCAGKFAPFFCANVTCLQYYCEYCWAQIHSRPGREYHKPLVKEGADRPRAVPFRWC